MALTAPAPSRAMGGSGPTREGMVLAAATFLMFLSGFDGLRIPVGPLAVHPFLVLLGPLFVFRVLPRFTPDLIRSCTPLLIAGAIYILASFPSRSAFSEMVKLVASLAIFLAAQKCIRTASDLRWVVIALVAAMAILAGRGLLLGSGGGLVGFNPMSGVANKNAFGAYAAPALACGGLIVLNHIKARRRVRWAVIGGSLVVVAAVFSTASRASWALVIFVIVYWVAQDRSPRAVLAIGVAGLTTYLFVTNVTGTEMIEHRLSMTQKGSESDDTRQALVRLAFEIGLENPFLGVGVDNMYRQLAVRAHAYHDKINAHNVYAHVIASSGLVALGLFLWGILRIAWLFRSNASKLANRFAPLPVIIFLIEGLVTHEVLYVPTMWLALGIALRLRTATAHRPKLAKQPLAGPLLPHSPLPQGTPA